MLEAHDIQGHIFSGYGRQPFAAYLFCAVEDAPRTLAWIGEILPQVTAGGVYDRDRTHSLNIAFTHPGFAALGFSKETLDTFSRPFIEGMAEPNRARSLGDNPGTWSWGRPDDDPIHVLLMLFATSAEALADYLAQHRNKATGAGGLRELFVIESEDLPDELDHFGFEDGISNPTIEGHAGGRPHRDGPGNNVKAGEFVLGYENEYGQKTFSPFLGPADPDPQHILPLDDNSRPDFGRNGAYLVLRQMKQDVAGFWNMLRNHTRAADGAPRPEQEEALGAKIFGRWRDGTPLALSPDRPGIDAERRNDFGYFDGDRYGLRCPLGSHIRRANPRDALLQDPETSIMTVKRHRLLRRGRPYGPLIRDRYIDDRQERGLVFITLDANIERQFEFVQHAWITAPTFAEHYDEADPSLGGRTREIGKFTVPAQPVRQLHRGIQPFVSVRGGAYFFLPGLRALNYLSCR